MFLLESHFLEMVMKKSGQERLKMGFSLFHHSVIEESNLI